MGEPHENQVVDLVVDTHVQKNDFILHYSDSLGFTYISLLEKALHVLATPSYIHATFFSQAIHGILDLLLCIVPSMQQLPHLSPERTPFCDLVTNVPCRLVNTPTDSQNNMQKLLKLTRLFFISHKQFNIINKHKLIQSIFLLILHGTRHKIQFLPPSLNTNFTTALQKKALPVNPHQPRVEAFRSALGYLKIHIKSVFGEDSDIHVYGSSVNGYASSTSDLDALVVLPDSVKKALHTEIMTAMAAPASPSTSSTSSSSILAAHHPSSVPPSSVVTTGAVIGACNPFMSQKAYLRAQKDSKAGASNRFASKKEEAVAVAAIRRFSSSLFHLASGALHMECIEDTRVPVLKTRFVFHAVMDDDDGQYRHEIFPWNQWKKVVGVLDDYGLDRFSALPLDVQDDLLTNYDGEDVKFTGSSLEEDLMAETTRFFQLKFKGDGERFFVVQFDITFSSKIVLYNSLLLRSYASFDRRARELGLLVKRWAKARNVANPFSGTLSSYSWVLLSIHFLQNATAEGDLKKPLLPNFQHDALIANHNNNNSTRPVAFFDPVRGVVFRGDNDVDADLHGMISTPFQDIDMDVHGICQDRHAYLLSVGAYNMSDEQSELAKVVGCYTSGVLDITTLFRGFFTYLWFIFDRHGQIATISRHKNNNKLEHFRVFSKALPSEEFLQMTGNHEKLRLRALFDDSNSSGTVESHGVSTFQNRLYLTIEDPLEAQRTLRVSSSGQESICREVLRALVLFLEPQAIIARGGFNDLPSSSSSSSSAVYHDAEAIVDELMAVNHQKHGDGLLPSASEQKMMDYVSILLKYIMVNGAFVGTSMGDLYSAATAGMDDDPLNDLTKQMMYINAFVSTCLDNSAVCPSRFFRFIRDNKNNNDIAKLLLLSPQRRDASPGSAVVSNSLSEEDDEDDEDTMRLMDLNEVALTLGIASNNLKPKTNTTNTTTTTTTTNVPVGAINSNSSSATGKFVPPPFEPPSEDQAQRRLSLTSTKRPPSYFEEGQEDKKAVDADNGSSSKELVAAVGVPSSAVISSSHRQPVQQQSHHVSVTSNVGGNVIRNSSSSSNMPGTGGGHHSPGAMVYHPPNIHRNNVNAPQQSVLPRIQQQQQPSMMISNNNMQQQSLPSGLSSSSVQQYHHHHHHHPYNHHQSSLPSQSSSSQSRLYYTNNVYHSQNSGNNNNNNNLPHPHKYNSNYHNNNNNNNNSHHHHHHVVQHSPYGNSTPNYHYNNNINNKTGHSSIITRHQYHAPQHMVYYGNQQQPSGHYSIADGSMMMMMPAGGSKNTGVVHHHVSSGNPHYGGVSSSSSSGIKMPPSYD